MRMNKLLFFFLALISLNSCVEYVDNGVKPDNGQNPEENKYTAELNGTAAKYVGDTFQFKAMLNNVDVTASTKFKVNGSDIKGSTYVPFKEGSHSVIATMDNHTANFKFTVLPKEEEPEPQGNRIEYGGSNPLTKTLFVLNGTETQNGISLPSLMMPDGTTPAVNWIMVNFNGTDLNTATNVYLLNILIPFDGKNINFPFEATQIAIAGGEVVVNSANPFTPKNMTLVFAQTGNTLPTQQAAGKANYTSLATGANSGESAELFWNGEYSVGIQPLKKNKINKSFVANIATSKTEFKNLKIAK